MVNLPVPSKTIQHVYHTDCEAQGEASDWCEFECWVPLVRLEYLRLGVPFDPNCPYFATVQGTT